MAFFGYSFCSSCLPSCPVGLQSAAAVPLRFGIGWAPSSAQSHLLSSLCFRRPANPEAVRQGRRLVDCGAGRTGEPLASAARATAALSWYVPRHRCQVEPTGLIQSARFSAMGGPATACARQAQSLRCLECPHIASARVVPFAASRPARQSSPDYYPQTLRRPASPAAQ